METECLGDLRQELQKKVSLGEELISKTSSLNHIEGIGKLKKKIKQEINFLTKVFHRTIKKEHLQCTNLHHFSALVAYLELHHDDCNAVMKHFPLFSSCDDEEGSDQEIPFGTIIDEGTSRINVDIVMKEGHRWVKVIARNPRALSQLSTGAGKFGQKTVIDQANQFVQCASQHPLLYHPPDVVFTFSNGIEETLARLLEKRGVIVEGDRIPDSAPLNWDDEEEEEEENEDDDVIDIPKSSFALRPLNLDAMKHLNLDVSTMVAYVSALTNGRCNFTFQQQLLAQQAEWERERPVKPILDQLFQGKQLFCCESANRDFRNIVDTMGGPEEKERSAKLLAQVTVVPDQCLRRVQALTLSGKIKRRSQLVFGTGDALKALTVSANEGFVRGAKNQGVEFTVFLHESRALTEVKEQQAMPL